MRQSIHSTHTLLRHTTSAAAICAALVLLLAVTLGAAARVHAQAPTSVTGQLLNGTHDAPANSLANVPVTLFQISASGPLTRTVATDATGHFDFGQVPMDSGAPFFASVNYAGLQYFSDVLQPQVGATSPLSLTVYETQTLPANFTIDRAHLILDVGQRTLSGVELVQVTNSTDRAFLMPLPLPDGATDINFDDLRDQFRAVQAPDGSTLFPILPTTTEILFGETLTTHPPDYTLTLPLGVGVGGLNVLVAQTGNVQASSTQLKTGPPFAPPQQSGTPSPQPPKVYTQLNGGSLPAGSVVSVAITNLPGADIFPTVRNVVLVVGALGALLLLAYPLARRRRGAAEDRSADAAGDRLARLRAIADLDEEYAAGEIAEEEYRAERAELKAELLDGAEHPAEPLVEPHGVEI